MQIIPAIDDTHFMRYYILIILLISTGILNAGFFRYIVAPDGTGDFTTVQAAINACPDNERSIIFIKNGTYYGQTYLGTKAVASSKIISLVGENRDSVKLTYDKSLSMVSTFEEATTFQIYSKNFYAENITFANTAGNTGQALALYTAGDMATFKNCYITGYQDTYRSKKSTRGYFRNCTIEGAVDFIYAGGVEFFDDCKINCIKGGGYIAAPEDAYVTIPKAQTTIGQFIRIGFFFRNCLITRNSDVPDNSYALGRPWAASSGVIYLNCKMDKHIKAAGWQSWNGNETTSFFAEYNSMDLNGNPVNVSGRVSWSYQLPQSDVDNLLSLSGIYARVSSTVYDPVTMCDAVTAPENVQVSGNKMSWNFVSGVKCYLIYKNGKFITAIDVNSFTNENGLTGNYTIYSMSADGVLSSPASFVSAVKYSYSGITIVENQHEITFSEPVICEIYNVQGKLLYKSNEYIKSIAKTGFSWGVFIVKAITEQQNLSIHKIVIK